MTTNIEIRNINNDDVLFSATGSSIDEVVTAAETFFPNVEFVLDDEGDWTGTEIEVWDNDSQIAIARVWVS